MTDRPNRFEDEDRRTDDQAPELDNSEQDEDAEEQAQTVADESRNRSTGEGLEDSEKVNSGDLGDDTQDLVDHMIQMDHSGRVDMDAYEGEPDMDDDDGKYGRDRKAASQREDES